MLIVDLDSQNALSDLLRSYIKKEDSDVGYYDTATKKQEAVEFDYLGRFYFEWEDAAIEVKYSVEMSSEKKINQKMLIGKLTRKKIALDESWLWSIASPNSMVRSKLKSITFAYLWHESEFERYFDITNETKDLTELTTTKKTSTWENLA